ncbi:MAG: PEP-CTERM sorting domain-containing protein [Proteobacteria bacterium]|nr:PEP-CTERM sorting domain-containing protein [Pseudomonadota bacterium]
MAAEDPAEAPPFAGAVSGGFGSAFSGLPGGAGLDDVQPLRVTPREATTNPGPATGPLAPPDPGGLASAAGAAPEPATWAMVLLGLGGLGALLRRANTPGVAWRRGL